MTDIHESAMQSNIAGEPSNPSINPSLGETAPALTIEQVTHVLDEAHGAGEVSIEGVTLLDIGAWALAIARENAELRAGYERASSQASLASKAHLERVRELNAALSEASRLREALEFYADGQRYDTYPFASPIQMDAGERARTALQGSPAPGKEMGWRPIAECGDRDEAALLIRPYEESANGWLMHFGRPNETPWEGWTHFLPLDALPHRPTLSPQARGGEDA